MPHVRIRKEEYLPKIKNSDYHRTHPAMTSCPADKKIRKWKENRDKIITRGTQQCPICKGSGKSGFLWFKCGACDGEGSVFVINCPECGGNGSVQGIFRQKLCRTCKGEGLGLFY